MPLLGSFDDPKWCCLPIIAKQLGVAGLAKFLSDTVSVLGVVHPSRWLI